MKRTLIQVGQTLTFVAPSGREIPVVVQSLAAHGAAYATVAQIADMSKTKNVPVESLRTADGSSVATQWQLDESARNAGLNAILTAKDRYECLECGAKHNRRTCPECGGQDRIENVR
ncbi:MAG TPA: hypothetical protein PKK15_06935 [Kouleothrix sp.]|nr:hypothetical protein [Kouleothrix sp.]